MTNDVNFTSTMDDIDDIDLRVKALETNFGLKGQVCVDMNLAMHAGVKPTWIGRIYLLDGRKEIATYEGGNFSTVVNKIFKDTWNVFKKTYPVGGTGTGTTAGQTRRTA